jgi:acetyl esterase/lipase
VGPAFPETVQCSRHARVPFVAALAALLLLCLGSAPAEAGDPPSAKRGALRKQYEESLKALKDDDEAGHLRLAAWCQANRLTAEAEQVWKRVLDRKREALAKNPTPAGYQALASWCAAQGRAQAAEEIRREMLTLDYEQRKSKIAADSVKDWQALAQWCQQNKLTAEAVESWRAVLSLQPDHAQARGQLDLVLKTAWAEAPTGPLKHQKVRGYTQETAWYHITVPKEYKEAKSGLPLFVFLHGGAHNAGTADNIVALSQVVPAFKKNMVLYPNHLKTWWAHPREIKYILDTLDQVQCRWRFDPKRIYLMGVSMGGNGVWGVGCQCPELFAALAPMSGFWAEFLEFPMKHLAAKPIYILHGAKDTTVPIGGARKAYELLKNEGAPVTMRDPDCTHQIPNDEIGKAADWLLQHANKQEFDLKALKERVGKLPVARWLKQYEGN